jgi:hypothetical protein
MAPDVNSGACVCVCVCVCVCLGAFGCVRGRVAAPDGRCRSGWCPARRARGIPLCLTLCPPPYTHMRAPPQHCQQQRCSAADTRTHEGARELREGEAHKVDAREVAPHLPCTRVAARRQRSSWSISMLASCARPLQHAQHIRMPTVPGHKSSKPHTRTQTQTHSQHPNTHTQPAYTACTHSQHTHTHTHTHTTRNAPTAPGT